MLVLTSQAIAFRQLPRFAPEGALKLQFGTNCERDCSQSSERRSARGGELDGAARPPESEFFLLLRAELEKSAGRAVAR